MLLVNAIAEAAINQETVGSNQIIKGLFPWLLSRRLLLPISC